MINKGLFSSATDLWSTPQYLFDILDKEFNFNLDVCADKDNAKCDKYFDKAQDGLQQEWTGTVWMNPPYGREIGRWIKKAYDSYKNNNATVVCLLPSRTDTKWWHDYCMNGETRFIKGRLKFGKSKNSAPFPSCIVIFSSLAELGKITAM